MFINKIEKYAETHSKIAGFLATIIGIISFLPVLYIVYKTKKTINFPYRTFSNSLYRYFIFFYLSFYFTDKTFLLNKKII